MTTQRRNSVAVSGLAIHTLALFVGGCGGGFETNQGACMRAINQIATCGASSVDVPPEFDFFISQLCATVPETSECDEWSAFADCVATVACTEFFTFDPQAVEECGEIQAALESNGCFPGSF